MSPERNIGISTSRNKNLEYEKDITLSFSLEECPAVPVWSFSILFNVGADL